MNPNPRSTRSYPAVLATKDRHLPDLDLLLNSAMNLTTPDISSPEEQDLISQAFRFSRETCEEFGFRILLGELSLIQDRRFLEENQKPFFVTYLFCGVENEGKDILQAYIRAMEFMKTEEAGADPIIPHPGLYERSYFTVPIAEITEELNKGDKKCKEEPRDSAASLYTNSSSRFFRFPYEPGRGKRDVLGQIKILLSRFLELLPRDAVPLFGHGTSLVIPFLRPSYMPVLSERNADNETPTESSTPRREATPGGALFVLIVPQSSDQADNQRGAQECALELALALHKAALANSYSEIEVNQTKSIILGGMIHGTLTAVRSINSTGLSALVDSAKACPPTTLSFEIHTGRGSQEDKKQADSLLKAIKKVCLAEDTAAALLTIAEIGSKLLANSSNVLPYKFTTREEVKLVELLNSVDTLVNSQVGPYAEEVSTVKLSEVSGFDSWLLPEGYLDSRVIRGIILEILKNCSRHGRPTPQGGTVDVTLKAEGQENSHLDILIESPVEDSGPQAWEKEYRICVRKKGRTDRWSFLVRLACLSEALNGLNVSSDIDRSNPDDPRYVTRLRLGTMTTYYTKEGNTRKVFPRREG